MSSDSESEDLAASATLTGSTERLDTSTSSGGNLTTPPNPDMDHVNLVRPRDRKLGLKAIESKIYQLNDKFSKSVNAIYRTIKDAAKQLTAEVSSLNALYEFDDTIISKIQDTINVYNELKQLYDNDEGKIPEGQVQSFNLSLKQAAELRETLDKEITRLEDEEQEERLQQQELARRLDEENRESARLFQQMLDQRNQTSSTRPEVSPANDPLPQSQQNREVSNRNTDTENASQQNEQPHAANVTEQNSQQRRELISSNTGRPTRQAQVESFGQLPTTQRTPPEIQVPQTNEQQPASAMEKLAEVLSSVVRPRSLEPEVFSGDNILNFKDWEVDLEIFLRNERIEGVEKLRYLKKYTSGEAKKAIEGHLLSNTATSYIAARKLLTDRYGNDHVVGRNFREKLYQWPAIKNDDTKALLEYSDFLGHLLTAKESVQTLQVLDDYSENERMTNKLPVRLKWKWAREVSKIEESCSRYPSFQEFHQFVKQEAKIGQLPLAQAFKSTEKRYERRNRTTGQTRNNFATSTDTSTGCALCKLTNHETDWCGKLSRMNRNDRNQKIRELGLCYKCLAHDHRIKDCTAKLKCRECGKGHATVHHEKNFKPRNTESTQQNTPTPTPTHVTTPQPGNTAVDQPQRTVLATAAIINGSTTMAIPVKISTATGRSVLVYGILDNMSDSCYICPNILSKLRAKVSAIEPDVTINTMNGPQTLDIERYDNLKITGYVNDNETTISAYKRPIHCDKGNLPSPERARQFRHLKDIANLIPPALDIPVGLLIGSNYTEAIQPLETRTSNQGEPFAVKTLFGWTMCGGRNLTPSSTKKTFVTSTDSNIIKLLERDFAHDTSTQLVSQEDKLFTEIMNRETRKDENGNYCMPLPFKGPAQLPNNLTQATRRFNGLMKRFKSDENYAKEYTDFMTGLLQSGHAELATNQPTEGTVWYLPHFGVRHKRKGKLRVVFDASATFHNTSLNKQLLTGPDDLNSLVGILLRFRREPIAITCDIQQMFYNFIVDNSHRDFLRFLWKTGDETEEYRMTKHLFGATSSPAVATYGLRRVAEDHRNISGKAADFLRDDFYVDDGVTSVATESEAVNLIFEAIKICSKANIRLHKFNSNTKVVLNSIPESERSDRVQSVNIFEEQLPTERTLGMEWNLETDSFRFSVPVSPANTPATKRNVLSKIAQLYDPMGLASPFILRGKLILQRITASDLEWDQLLDPEDMQNWTDWLDDLENLPDLIVKRCIKPKEPVKTMELHHFSDASSQGYGSCSYVRYITDQGNATSELIYAKSRVAPLRKVTTIPRMELQGAVTSSRTANMLRKELKMDIEREYFWTDSKITLGYIQNESKRFHVYVANRVAEIRDLTRPEQWNHVSSGDNPADLASRSCSAADLQKKIWLHGPDFLQEKHLGDYIANNAVDTNLPKDDPELYHTTTLTTQRSTTLTNRFRKFGTWTSLVRGIATLRKVIQVYQKTKTTCTGKVKIWKKHTIETQDLLEAEHFIIRSTQREAFPGMVGEDTLKSLNPKLNDKEQLCVGGRTLSKIWDLPVIIPKHSHLGTLIIRHYHQLTHHMGYRSTLAAVREKGYWIINGPSMVKNVLMNCIGCKRLKGKTSTQYMGPLPSTRLERAAPFTHIGADIFGPYYVKEKRSDVKRWGLMITCFYSRAVHLEILEEMTTDCLTQALRSFMAIRGPISSMTVDNGTNFVGLKNEQQRESCIDNPQMKEYLKQNRIEFRFNTPTASHQGGSTKRMIRTARSILNSMKMQIRLVDTKTLRTAFYEVTNIINSRPLTGTTITNAEDPVLTPNMLLTGKSTPLVAPPPGSFETEEIYSRKRWKHSQVIAEEFWKVWKVEYLDLIMKRSKWTNQKDNLAIGDVVMIKDEGAARGDWRIGRISDTRPGKDGMVRNAEVTLGNPLIDTTGKPIQKACTLVRPITKLVVLLKAK